MTEAAVLALAMQCLPPSLAPIAVGIALHENPRLDTTAISHNINDTDDYGLAQINTINLPWLGLTPTTVLQPCPNLRAAIRVLFAKYNGNPPDAVKAAYSASVLSNVSAIDGTVADRQPPIPMPHGTGNPFTKPAVTGRDLVFAVRKDR